MALLKFLGMSLALAGIMGVGRSWTAWMISVLSIPRRYAEVIPIPACPGWRRITSRDPFAGPLDGVCMAVLMGREPPPHAGYPSDVA